MVELGVQQLDFMVGLVLEEARYREQGQRRLTEVLRLDSIGHLALHRVARWWSNQQYPQPKLLYAAADAARPP